jgi:hypothetical protein
MIAYAEWADVQTFLPPDSQNSTALENAATVLLPVEYRAINARLGERFVVPFVLATQPNAYAWAKDINAKIVAAKAMLAVRSPQGEEDGASWYPDRLLAEANAALDAAASGNLYLSDATLSTTEATETRATDGYSDLSSTEQGYIAPWFERHDTW